MKKIIQRSFLIIFLLTTISCGFKVMDGSAKEKFTIKEISTTGDKRINYKIKNNLLAETNKSSSIILIVNLETNKNKSIKEKNIKNEIEKYEILIKTKVRFNLENNKEEQEFNVEVIGEYSVGDRYSASINAEKSLINGLTMQISNKIRNQLNIKINDL